MSEKQAIKWANDINMKSRFNGDVFINGKKQSKFMSGYYRKKFRLICEGK